MGVRQAAEQPVTEDEVNILIAQGVLVGAFAEEERQIVERVFRTADRRVSQLMTPRREIVALDVEDGWDENRAKILGTPHAAFVVCAGGLDEIVGVVSLKTIWSVNETAREASPDLHALATPPLYVLETTRALAMLETFKRTAGQHLALVVDEYGNAVGLITLHDVVEGIVGPLPSEDDVRTQDLSAVRRDDGSWLLDGMLAVGEMTHLLDVRTEPEDTAEYNTLGGFVMARLGTIPTVGEHFVWENFAFEVMDMDGHRVDKVLVTPPASTLDTESSE